MMYDFHFIFFFFTIYDYQCLKCALCEEICEEAIQGNVKFNDGIVYKFIIIIYLYFAGMYSYCAFLWECLRHVLIL